MNPLPIATNATSHRGIPVVASVAADVILVCGAALMSYLFAAAFYAAIGWELASASKVFGEREWSLPVLTAGIVAWFYLTGHYHSRSPFWDESRRVFEASGFALLSEGFILFAGKADGSRVATFLTWAAAPFLIMGGRSILRKVMRKFGRGEARALVVGRPSEAAAAGRAVTADAHLGYRVVGASASFEAESLLALARALEADTVIVALSGDDAEELAAASLLREAGYRVVLVPPLAGFTVSGTRMQYVIGQESTLLIDKIDVVPRLSRFAKRTFDLAVTSAALLVAAIPMLIVALLVKLDGGPAIFGHERVGLGGRKFKCLKFRSMASDAAARLEEHLAENPEAREEWEQTRKLKNDPRVTRLGRFIRKTALDELPQLINVLKGDMSLVGPRPVTEPELAYYGGAEVLYKSVRPGVTGLWQVSGRNDLTYDQRVGLDTWYVKNWSPWHDTAIILKTVPALLLRRGAY